MDEHNALTTRRGLSRRVTAVILSGGDGVRAGFDIPKQYMEVGGKPVIMYTLERFERCDAVDDIIIVLQRSWQDLVSRWCDDYGISKIATFAPAGVTRQESVLNGLERCALHVKDMNGTCVIIHDAARPLVSASLIEKCIRTVGFHDGCMPALGVTDTIYLSESGQVVTGLLDRSSLYAGQSPEAFSLSLYLEANRAASAEELAATRGSAEIAFRHGLDVAIVEGDAGNFKITTQEDFRRFEQIIRRGQ